MSRAFNYTHKKYLSLYLAIVIALTFTVVIEIKWLEYVLRALSIPVLIVLYLKVSSKINWFFVSAFIFATISNVLFTSTNQLWLFWGLIAFLLFRISTLYIVFKATKKIYLLSLLLGSLVFFVPLFYFILLTAENINIGFVPALVNVILIALLGGLSLSNYLFEPGFKNTWLLISTIVYTFIIFLFVIQKYYLYIQIFEPIRVISLMTAHYLFLWYVLLCEKSNLDAPAIA